ncbi:glucokinase [Candidatus Woesearchaeota archaeon]|nr:glucokinase [Candidatus Woesearchaeota archaeon]
MNFRKEVFGRIPSKPVFVADVGGTYTRAGICSVVGKKVKLCALYTFPTSEVKRFADVAKAVLSDCRIKKPFKACISGAGPVSDDRRRLKLVSAKLALETKSLPFKALLLNDIEAQGYAINILTPRDVKSVRSTKPRPKQLVGIVSAGTGLGMSYLDFCPKKKIFIPRPSEGGHSDLPIKTSDEFILSKGQFEYEDVLSGRGIVRIYEFLRQMHTAPNLTDPAIIMASNTTCARATKQLFASFYARCIRNFALLALARGGIFIGGGIAAKNANLFGSAFVKEFLSIKTPAMAAILKQIPVKVITNEHAGLLGCAFAAVNAQ